MTNADRIRNMSDEELAEWLTNMCDIEKDEEPYKSIYNSDTRQEEEIHDSYGDLLKWLKSESEVIELKDAIEIVKQGGVSDDVCEWKYNDSEYYFESSCKHLHIFMSGGPKENEYRFCPYCGKKIKIVGD